MTNVDKNSVQSEMHMHTKDKEAIIKDSFKMIDEWLPSNYISRVQEKVTAPSGTIRNVKCNRKGDLRIILAMVEVAKENKEAFYSLKNSI
ncbi:hypothetical protein [Myroides odoratimimus]|uniref:hypothetical protein n=1 Tax=Myroides odoratimimus TaxID=76832 RepID=UPI002576CA66|nr:hypothetical protein [Myroides odoratimimus]MDM1529042.1 hypothetical protein [Myroides odoratimimus]